MSVKQFFTSVSYAIRGAKRLWQTEQNFRLQLFAGLIVLILAFLFPFETWERIVFILLIAMVLILEAINSVFERLVDVLKSRIHPSVRDMKDIMAAAVLVSAVVAVIVGAILFVPMIKNYL